jgi:hypothetical protein
MHSNSFSPRGLGAGHHSQASPKPANKHFQHGGGLTPFQQHLQQLQQHPVAHHGHHPVHPHPAHYSHANALHADGQMGGGGFGPSAAVVAGLGLDLSISHAVVHNHLDPSMHPLHPLPHAASHAQAPQHGHGYLPADIPFAHKGASAQPHAHIPHVAHGMGVGQHPHVHPHAHPHPHAPHPLVKQASVQIQQGNMTVPWNNLAQQQQQRQLLAAAQLLGGTEAGASSGAAPAGVKVNTLRDVVMKLKKQPVDAMSVPAAGGKVSLSSKIMSSKANQLLAFAKITPKMSQETNTDDLEAYIAAQNAEYNEIAASVPASGPGDIVPLAQAGRGRSKRGVGELSKQSSLRAPGLNRGRSNRQLDSGGGAGGGLNLGSNMGSKAVSPLAFEAIMETATLTATSNDSEENTGRQQGALIVDTFPPLDSAAAGDDVSVCSPLTIDDSVPGSDIRDLSEFKVTTSSSSRHPSAKISIRSDKIAVDKDMEVTMITSSIAASRSSKHLSSHSVDDHSVAVYAQYLEADKAATNHEHADVSIELRAGRSSPHGTSPACASPHLIPLAPLGQAHLSDHAHAYHHHPTSRTKSPSSKINTPRDGDLHFVATGTSMLPQLNHPATYTSELVNKLKHASNPLQLLYDEFQSALPDFHKTRLLLAISSVAEADDDDYSSDSRSSHLDRFLAEGNHLNSFRQAKRFFAAICPLIEKLVKKASLGILGIESVEKLLINALSILGGGGGDTVEGHVLALFDKSVQSLYK